MRKCPNKLTLNIKHLTLKINRYVKTEDTER